MASQIRQIEDSTLRHFLPLVLQFALVRLVSVFGLSLLLGLSWFYRLDYNIVPVIGFRADIDQFSLMNTVSQFITFIFTIIGLIYSTRFHSSKTDALGDVIASILGVLMSVEMVVISLFLNPFARFEVQRTLVVIMVVVGLISFIYSYFWIRKWRKLNRKARQAEIDDEEAMRNNAAVSA